MSLMLQKNYFELLGLPLSFAIDIDVLENNYLKLQQNFHPDKFVSAPAVEQRLAVQFTTQLNSARSCLLSDVQRAKYMLQLQSVDVPDEHTVSDMDFLMQQMQWREDLEVLTTSAELADFNEKMQTFAQMFADEFVAGFKKADWPSCKHCLAKMQFMQKILNDVAEKISQ